MIIHECEFLTSSAKWSDCPPPTKPEFAFVGRSNVGKSSLINALTNRNKLAKVSSTPGKTQTINHFQINGIWYLVDLPGYGYARVSNTQRKSWQEMVRNYLLHRENLLSTFILVDSRLEPQKNDLEFISWMGQNGLPFCIVFTKADKQSALKTQRAVDLFNKEL